MSRLLVFAALLFVPPAHAEVTIDWVTVGDPGNAPDTTGLGAVAYAYQIGKHEVTNAQYAEFLNAVAETDTNGLYNTNMGSGYGGITRSGSSGSYTYSTISGREGMPVDYVSFWDSLRFANWLHNGRPTGPQGSSTTEDGAYTITAQGIADNSITRNAGANTFLANEDEWYKAAYYKGGGTSAGYWSRPTGSDTMITCALPGPTPNTANCQNVVGDLTAVGSYTGSPSPYGTFDQAGNVYEWNDTIIGSDRGVRGVVSFAGSGVIPGWSLPPAAAPTDVGIRVASIRESEAVPSLGPVGMALLGGLVFGLGAMGLAVAARRRRA